MRFGELSQSHNLVLYCTVLKLLTHPCALSWDTEAGFYLSQHKEGSV